MKKISKTLLALIIIAAYLLIYSSLGRILRSIPFMAKNYYLAQVVAYIIMTIFLIIVLFSIKKTHILKSNLKNFIKGFFVGGFVVFIIIFTFFDELQTGIQSGSKFLPIYQIILFTVGVVIGTGFTEELLCRGIVQNLMYDAFGKKTKKGIYLSIICSSVLFGAAHFVNYFTVRASFTGVLTQVIVATVIGLYFGAIYSRCNSIWSVALIHGLFDFVQMIQEGFWGIGDISSTISSYKLTQIAFPVALYVFLFLFLLRKKKIKECLDN